MDNIILWYYVKKNFYRLDQGKNRKNECFEYEQVSEASYQWFRVQWDKGIPISGPILQETIL